MNETDGEVVSIELSVAEIDGEIALDGHAATSEEILRARHTVDWLRGILPRLSAGADIAQAQYEVGTLLGWPLEAPEESLEAHREAHQANPLALGHARGYRKAAIRAGNTQDLVNALEVEAKLSESRRARALLNMRRAQLLESDLQNKEAARFSYLQSHDAEPDAEALESLERLALEGQNATDAAIFAQRQAGVVTDPIIRAEHLARAARHLERSGDARGALALAIQAQVHSPTSPSVSFTVERLLTVDGAWAELASLREGQIENGYIDAVDAWFDAGLLAHYRLHDAERARTAFAAAIDATRDDDPRRPACLEQLAAVLECDERWEELLDVYARRADLCSGRERAQFLARLGAVHDERLGNVAEATKAYDDALEADPTWVPALEGAGRLAYAAGGDPERLLRMHRLQAEAAATRDERGHALRRAGELLIKNEATLQEGIETLREAHDQLPDNLSVLQSLERGLSKWGHSTTGEESLTAWKMLVDLYEHELENAVDPSRRAWLLAQMGLLAADRLGDKARAIQALTLHMEMGERHPAVPLSRLAELLEDGDHDNEVVVLERIAAETSGETERANILQRIAALHERRGNLDEAISTYESAVRIAPATHPVFAEAGRALLRAGRHEELVTLMRAGAKDGENADRARWLVKSAHVMSARLGEIKDALDTLREALALDPKCSLARERMLHLLCNARRYTEVADVLPETVESDANGLLARAILLEAAGDEDAVHCYRQALDAGQPLAWLPYTRLAGAAGRWEQLEASYAASTGSHMMVHHHRYRAGEISLERLDAPERAASHWLTCHAAAKSECAPLVALLPLMHRVADAVDLLASLQASTRDSTTRMACLRRRIDALDKGERSDEALAARMDVLSQHPSEPWVLVEVELELERRGDRFTLAEVLKAALADPALEPASRPSMQAHLGSVLEQLGALRDAVAAFEAARVDETEPKRSTLLALRRCYDATEDDHVGEVLAALSRCAPVGPEQSLACRALAWWWMEAGDTDQAIEAIERGLSSHPCDYDALNDLADMLGDVHADRVTDAMLRAFELEQDVEVSEVLGLTLATRLIADDRLETARETVDRILARTPDRLEALMLHAELAERRESWVAATSSLNRIADLDATPARVRVEALLRLAGIQKDRTGDSDGAKATTQRLLAMDAQGELSAQVKADVEEAFGEYEAAAESLEALTRRDGLQHEERGALLMRLAALYDEHLEDPSAALDALGRVTDVGGRENALRYLLDLGDKNGRWDLVSQALESMLDRTVDIEPSWEIALRRRLADVLHNRLDQAAAAVPHFERVVQLDPTDAQTLVLLADKLASESSAKAIAFHRQLLVLEPGRIVSYRALRKLFLDAEQTDGAFCAEAVLVGLNAADEEERYFYRQRRLAMKQSTSAVLSSALLDRLLPERHSAAFKLFAALEPTLSVLFGVDRAAYGIEDQAEESRILSPVASSVAKLFTVPRYRVVVTSPVLPATSEPGDPPLVIVPRTLEDALRREQQFVFGAIFGRMHFRGIGANPARVTPLDAKQVEQLLVAACDVAGTPINADVATGAIYADVKKRLARSLHGDDEEAILAAAKHYAESDHVTGDAIVDGHVGASVRAGMLAAQDPSVAVRCLRMFGTMFEPECEPGVLSPGLERFVPFAVSETHLELRAALASDAEEGSS